MSRISNLSIVILGYIVRGPLGGLVWHHLQYIIGLKRLGHNVLFLEYGDDYDSCYRPDTNEVGHDPSYGLSFIDSVFSRHGLQDCWAYYDRHSRKWYGKDKTQVRNYCRSADLLFNLSAVNPLDDWTATIPARALVDTDPAFTQIRHLKDISASRSAARHNVFFTFAENFGHDDCHIPKDGFPWQPTRQPMVMDLWPTKSGSSKAPWTTVMQWDSYRIEQYGGKDFGMKSASFDPYLDLPQKTSENFKLAIGSATVPRDKLKKNGWTLSDPLQVTKTTYTYQHFIQFSKGEWSVAKHGYVSSNSGWFSERSAAYLASGRPVLVQDTGFSRHISTGNGLHAFQSPEECCEAFCRINDQYLAHCRWAREIADSYFEASSILNDLINRMI